MTVCRIRQSDRETNGGMMMIQATKVVPLQGSALDHGKKKLERCFAGTERDRRKGNQRGKAEPLAGNVLETFSAPAVWIRIFHCQKSCRCPDGWDESLLLPSRLLVPYSGLPQYQVLNALLNVCATLLLLGCVPPLI